jgi:PleD family two-component response regulator
MSHLIMSDEQSSVATVPGLGPGTQHADGTQVRVLVVDDEPSLAELLSSVLRYEGWSVRTAGSGTEAIKAGREFRPDAGCGPSCPTSACCS